MESLTSTTLNLDKICRVCLGEYGDLFSIYSEFQEDNNEEKMPAVYEILISISNIKVYPDDSLPIMVCTDCIEKAHNAYKFQQQCNRSQSLLDSYKEQIIKQIKEAAVSMSEAIKENISLDIDEELVKMSKGNDDTELNSVDGMEDDDNDCDDLKNCLPLGEDTIDELIKDNLQVDNLEMISPKITFSLDLTDGKLEERPPEIPEKISKEILNYMGYYKRDKGNSKVEYECNICWKFYKSVYTLRTHLKSHDEEKPYVCSECKKAFKVYGSLMHHIRSHSGEQPYECKECGKKYKQAGTLRAHMRIHTGSKPFLCTICGRGFRQSPDLTYHMRTHTKEKPYMCTVCGRTMSMQCHLVQHMRSHTGEKPFKCNVCDKAFPSSTRLKRHSIVHTNSKPFKCDICDKCFNRSSGLSVHKKTHSDTRSLACTLCDKTFLWAHSLRAHIATHSKNDEVEKEIEMSALASRS